MTLITLSDALKRSWFCANCGRNVAPGEVRFKHPATGELKRVAEYDADYVEREDLACPACSSRDLREHV